MSKQQKLGLLLIAVLLCIKWLLVPWFNWQYEKAQSIQQLQFSKQRFSDLAVRADALLAQQQNIREGYKQLAQLWYSGETIQAQVQVMRYIEQLAAKHALELTTRNTGQPINEPIAGLPVSLFIAGHPQNLFTFLQVLENQQPAAVIQAFTVTQGFGGGDRITATLDLMFLLKPQGAE